MAMEIIFVDVIKKRAKMVMHAHRKMFTTAKISMNAKLIPIHVHRTHCVVINKVDTNANVPMVSRVIHVSILTNAVTNVLNHLKGRDSRTKISDRTRTK